MQAITVSFVGPTNTKPSRWSVRAQAGRMIVSKGHYCDTNDERDARLAAEAFVAKFKWNERNEYELIEGGLPNGDRVFVMRHKSY